MHPVVVVVVVNVTLQYFSQLIHWALTFCTYLMKWAHNTIAMGTHTHTHKDTNTQF